jgi:hypothetical protein
MQRERLQRYWATAVQWPGLPLPALGIADIATAMAGEAPALKLAGAEASLGVAWHAPQRASV